MATEVQNHSEPSMTSLVSGIVSDMQDLVKQQLLLMRREIEEDLRKSAEAASIFAWGAGFLLLGAIPLCLMLVYLIHWAASPPVTDPASFPLWACHGVVGAVLLVIGGVLMGVARQKMKSVNPLQNPATEALQENVQWLTTPK
jgi:Putative Actinobacterial Holin-X, holin superfamily III